MGDYRALMISLKRYLDVSRGRGGPPLCVRSRRLSRMTREHDGQHGCTQNRVEQKNPREDQRYRDNQQQTGAEGCARACSVTGAEPCSP